MSAPEQAQMRYHELECPRRMVLRVLAMSLLALSGLFGSLTVAAADASTAYLPAAATVRQQPALPPAPTLEPRFSTIPPLPPTATPVRLVSTPVTNPTRVPVATAAPTRAVPAPAPTLRPTIVVPAPAQAAPRAGGFPLEVAMVLFAGSVSALGGGAYLFRRGRQR